MSELIKRRGRELPYWPSPLIFLLAYNVLRLQFAKGYEGGRARSRAAAAAVPVSATGDAASPAILTAVDAAAATEQQQQLSWASEAAAAQLLLQAVNAIEKKVTFPDSVNALCGHKTVPVEVDGGPKAVRGTLANPVPTAAPTVSRQCSIRLAGLREVGSFLWALNRAEGGYDRAVPTDATNAVQSTAAPEVLSAESLLESSNKLLTIQEAARIAAQTVKRRGGFADKLALYYEAAIREANERLLQRSSASGTASCRAHPHQSIDRAVTGHLNDEKGGASAHSALEALKAFCREVPDTSKPAVSLRSLDLPSLGWVSTAGVSLGLLLNFYSSYRFEIRRHILWVS